MLIKRIAPVLMCLLILCTSVWAQTAGNIRGVVEDPEGKPLPGVTITISSSALLGQTRTTYTNELGVFRFPSVPVGTYKLEASMEQFQKVIVERVDVSLEKTANVPISMSLSKLAEAVTTIGDTPLIDVTDASVSSSYKGPMLEEVPTQHSQFYLMQLSPGVSATTGDAAGDRTIAFGSNQQSNAWYVDGVDLSAPETGSVWFTLNSFLIEEIQVMGVGASAEYGNMSGAAFNVVTKKGGNDFHGGAQSFFLTDGLTETNVEIEGPTPDSAVFHRLEYRNVAGQLGGPIMKDKLWFYGGIQTYRDSSSQPGVDPALAEQVKYKSDKYDVKINGRLSDKHEVSGFFHWEEWDSPNTLTADYEITALPGEGGTNPAWGGSLTSTLSQNFLLEASYSGWWADDIYDSVIGAPFEDPVLEYVPGPGLPLYSGGTYYPWDYVTWRSSFRGKATYYAENFLNSEHEFKFGVQYSLGKAYTNISVGVNGFYTYTYYGEPYARYYQAPFVYGADNKELGVFLDDTITVNDQLTLNLGVRFDHNTGVFPDFDRLTVGTPSVSPAGNYKSTGETIPGTDVIDWNMVSPRVGAVFQPTRDGRSKIQGSFGVYYDHNVTGNWDFPPPQVPPLLGFLFNPETGNFDIPFSEVISVTQINSNIDPPRTLQYSAGFEQQFTDSVAAGIQYVYKDTQDLVGWQLLGGVYEPVIFVDPENPNNVVTLFNIIEAPIQTKGNDPGDFCSKLPQATACKDGAPDYWQKYHGVLVTFEKRFSKKWGLNANYTYSKSEGLIPRLLSSDQFNPFYGGSDGSDPNNFTNGAGRLQGDRPHMFRLQAVFFDLPGGLQASVTTDFSSGKHFNRQIRPPSGTLDQGRKTVILERGLRLDPIQALDVSVTKRIHLGSNAAIRIDAAVYNLLNSENALSFDDSPFRRGVEVIDLYTQPRRLELGVGFQF